MEKNIKIFSYLFIATMISIALFFHLLPAAIAGCTVYLLTDSISRNLLKNFSNKFAKIIALSLISFTAIGIVSGLLFYLVSFIKGGDDNITLLLSKLTSVLGELKNIIPENIQEHIPKTALEAKEALIVYLNEHSSSLSEIGKHSLKQIVHVIMGMIIGAMVSFYGFIPHEEENHLLVKELKARVINFADSFKKVVFSQVKISGINSFLTGIFLLLILPIFDFKLPYVKTLILITFVAGLIPVLGNLISNSVIFLVALSVSVYAGIASLVFLVVVHKLEYFINAKIIGDQIKATAWELLLSMLIMETLFGVSGIILAPILYAYIKNELGKHNLI